MHADIALARRLEALEVHVTAANAQSVRDVFGTGQAGSLRVAGGAATSFGPSIPMHSIKGVGLNGPMSVAEFDAAERFIASRGGTSVTLDVCPLADESVGTLAAERGYRFVGFESVLYRVISKDEELAAPAVDIRSLSPEQAEDWSKAMGLGFADGGEVPPWIVDFGRAFFAVPRCTPMGVFDGSALACAGIMITLQNTAGLLSSATTPQFRRRGFQTALIQHRLRTAQAAGCDLAKMDTKPGTSSQRNAERLGFRVAYTRAQFSKSLA